MVFVRGTFRVVLNVHSLNTEGAVGNYNPLVKVLVVGRSGESWDIAEVNAVSGNMLKHWHAKHVAEIAKANGLPLCDDCKRGVFYRTRIKANSEEEMIKKCVLDDLHGFLCTETTVKRESLIKLSFAIPVEEKIFGVVTVTHNRVVTEESGAIAREGMMPFKNEYASGLYAFAISMDLKYVGIPLANPDKKAIDNEDERKIRAKLAIQALGHLLQGEVGAKQARAFPIARPVEALVVISKKPIPAPIHGYYKDYIIESLWSYIGLVNTELIANGDFEIHMYPQGLLKEKVEKLKIIEHNSIGSLVNHLLKKVDEWL
ncbi:MAG: type I-A CRISPR-associated protein Cas7/Csa2 [Candidatus Njordarchaeales archaeon]